MSGTQEIVQIKPVDLKFPFELHKEIKSSFHILSKTKESVAFKVKSTSPKKYRVTPNHGLLQPDSDFNIVVTMNAQTEAPADMNCKDKFLVQAIIAPENMVIKNINDVTNIMLQKGPGKVQNVTLPVAYVQQSDREGSNANVVPSVFRRGSGSEEADKRPRGQVHFEKPETIEEGEEEGEEKEEPIPVASQNPNEMQAQLREEVQKREKLEKELAKVKIDLENNKKMVEKLQQKLCCIDFKFEELQKATDDFAEIHKIGEGTFGAVYKGILHHTQVAIKKLKFKDERGFNEEIETLSKVRHPNLVTLIGACRDTENPALVYEYLPQGSLQDHLNRKKPPLSGQIRIRVALEICSALTLLHSTLRSHGDLKPDNVLLDSNYVSKLSDFGTCRQLEHTVGTFTPSYFTKNITGTPAYMDPNYISSGVMTPWFDVYSFGVVLLQLATGKGACVVNEKTKSKTPLRDIVDMAFDQKNFDKLIDSEWQSKEAPEKMAKLGLQCFEPKWRRPDAAKLFDELMSIALTNDVHLY